MGTFHLYSRVSTDRQANQGYSLVAQQQQLSAWVKGHKIQHPDLAAYSEQHYIEDGESAFKKPFRTRLKGQLIFAASKKGDIIVCTKMDRAFRNTNDMLNTYEALEAKGVRLILLDFPAAEGPVGALIRTILAALAQFESSLRSERVKAALNAKRINVNTPKNDPRTPIRGPSPKGGQGYRPDLHWAIDQAIDLRADGHSETTISWAIEQAICAKEGRKFIRSAFVKPVYGREFIRRVLRKYQELQADPDVLIQGLEKPHLIQKIIDEWNCLRSPAAMTMKGGTR